MNHSCAGISRASRFSPNRECHDAAVFALTAEYLREEGWQVELFTEESFLTSRDDRPCIFHMARGCETLDRLKELEDNHASVINTTPSIRNCRRDRLTSILLQNGIPYPDSFIIDATGSIEERLRQTGMESCWLKRSDAHTTHPEDIGFAPTADAARRLLASFAARGIGQVIVNRHLPGDVIKFYGVEGEPFFYWCYPTSKGLDKFGNERINGTTTRIPFEEEALRDIASHAARLLGLCIYGGDAIVSPDGSVYLVDINDWPSFSPCLHEAVAHIGRAIIKNFTR